jgi:hypothetical protein
LSVCPRRDLDRSAAFMAQRVLADDRSDGGVRTGEP